MDIMVVDDHPIVCDSLRRYLEQTAKVPVKVKTANTLHEATAAMNSEYSPDFVFLDLNLDSENQNAATLERFQKQNTRSVPVIVFTGISPRDDNAADIIRACFELQAKTVIFKGANIEQMFVGLERILAGEQWMAQEVVSLLLKPPSASPIDLTPRQWEVARLVSRGLQDKEIARELNTTHGNIRQINASIFKRLNIRSRVVLADIVRKSGKS
jgi:two-component system, NarL family, nitrate/nitrite response regulator NarL